MVRRLVVEPVWIGLKLQMTGVLVDIGSGNGSPAIPLHVVSGLSHVHLVEARAKRAAFLRQLAIVLQLAEVTVHRSRFEEVAPTLGPVTWVTLQGVAFSQEVLDSIRPIAGPTTTVVWITAGGSARPLEPIETVHVPLTRTEVLLFRLNHY